MGHAAFIDLIVAAAQARRRAAARAAAARVEYRQGRGFGLVAARDVALGEVVVRCADALWLMLGHSECRAVRAGWRGGVAS